MFKHLSIAFLVTIFFVGNSLPGHGAEPTFGICLPGTKLSHAPISNQCSINYEKGNFEAARKEFTVLAKKGVAAAQTNLGQMARRGNGMEASWVKARKWFKLAADQGLALAQLNLGYVH